MLQKAGADHPRQVAGEEVAAAVAEVGAPPHDGDSAIRKAMLDGLPEAPAVSAQDEMTGGSVLKEAATELLGYCCMEVRSHEGIRVVGVEVSAPRKHVAAGHMPAFASVPVLGHPRGASTAAGAVPVAAYRADHTQTGAWHAAFQDRPLRSFSPSFHDLVVPFPSLAFLARTSTCPLRV